MADSSELESNIRKVLSSSYAPSGEEGVAEIAEHNFESEKFVENVYRDCVQEFGQTHAITTEVFFKLYDIWIGLYRLDKCETELVHFGQDSVRSIQAWAFLRWKQGILSEAIQLFERMERMMTVPSAALAENMAHTYSSLGDLDKAQVYFEKAKNLAGSNKGGIFLGLGLLKNRRYGGSQGLEECLDAYNWYFAKFSKKGNVSSLEGKCAMSLAKMYTDCGDEQRATEYADIAVANFRITCGHDSPLLSSALRTKGDVLWKLTEDSDAARNAYMEALSIEACKDGINLVELIELINLIVDTIRNPTRKQHEGIETLDRTAFGPLLRVCLDACDTVRRRLPKNADMGAFLKIVAETAIWANELQIAKDLLGEAVPLFEAGDSQACAVLIAQSNQILGLIDSRIIR
jgi:tetratricopeptide (TPR) repeat protein